ncbi:hypothetical protein RJ641_004152 [Dillenia turbinata]|uniref:Serine aminopeptidase S33 domain-containing protein n=1 Tax=Dillenia turbinata TaxID=194707 RepID=A0AAN8VLV9_9MAGN
MGAVTGLMYGAEDPSIAGMLLDSPFSDLVDMMMKLVDTCKVRLAKFTVKFAIQYMQRAIQKKAKFDIMDLNAIKVAKSSFVPLLLGHAIDDDFNLPHHSDRIYEAYVGDKNIIKFEGDHNSPRPQFYFDSINIFLMFCNLQRMRWREPSMTQHMIISAGVVGVISMKSVMQMRNFWELQRSFG